MKGNKIQKIANKVLESEGKYCVLYEKHPLFPTENEIKILKELSFNTQFYNLGGVKSVVISLVLDNEED